MAWCGAGVQGDVQRAVAEAREITGHDFDADSCSHTALLKQIQVRELVSTTALNAIDIHRR
jgi:hypothetical protein